VENAIQHAIAPRATPGRITIESKKENDQLHLEVKDDGAGIDAKNVGEREGIGLSNVRARLQQTYGINASLSMSNGPAGGFSVVMKFPSA